ncbi:MAG TPA: hypothetical protein VGB14_04945 [Acidimicrobiales bacterium]|jgi:hypothetical protein
MGRRLLPALALAPFGALVAHAAGYGIAPGSHGPAAHGYLGTVASAAVPAAAAVALWLGCGRAGSRRPLPPVPVLAALQVAVFAVQEVAERLVARVPLADLAAAPAVRWALAAQVVAAAAVLLAVRLARAAWSTAAAAVARRRPAPASAATPPAPRPPVAALPRRRPPSPATRRGPPGRLAPA